MFSLAPILLVESWQLLLPLPAAECPSRAASPITINLSAFVGTLFVLYLREQAKGM